MDLPRQELQFYLTAPYPCSYFPNRLARSQVAAPANLIGKVQYCDLIEQGFRRCGLYTYRPWCGTCHACVPLRVRVKDFKPNRSQRRALDDHCNLQAILTAPYYKSEHYRLYQSYQQIRHKGGGMDQDSKEQYAQFLLQSHVDTRLVEFVENKAEQNISQLRIVSLIDVLDDGLSAVYTFFDPMTKASFGNYAILWQIELARSMDLPYLYLGFWIEQNRKMAYKSRFKPNECLVGNEWILNWGQSEK